MKTTEKRRRAAAYCRVSTGMECQEGSYETQISHYRERIAADAEAELVGIYADEGSGLTTRRRPQFQKLLQDCEEGKIDVIYTKSISRFSRNILDCVTAVRRLKELGVAVIFEKEGINTMDDRNELFFHIMAIIAEEESRSIGGNVKAGIIGRHERGIPTGRVTYGYRRIDHQGLWRIEESEAKRVRYAFEQAAKGVCYEAIRSGLDAMENAEGTGVSWSKCRQRVPMLLRCVAYIGDYVTDAYYTAYAKSGQRYSKRNQGERGRVYLEGHHAPIVSRELFERVQRMMDMHLLHSNRSRFSEEEQRVLNDLNWQ